MNRFADVLNGDGPNMATVISGGVDPVANPALVRDIDRYSDVVEFRYDMHGAMDREEVYTRLGAFSVPILGTVRKPNDGGRWYGSETARIDLLKDQSTATDATDIETDIDPNARDEVIDVVHQNGGVVVASRHFRELMPEIQVLEDEIAKFKDSNADILKLAMLMKSGEQYHKARNFLMRNSDVEIIVIGMGNNKHARRSRRVFPIIGSRLTYAHDGTGPVAPGQKSYKNMRRSIDGEAALEVYSLEYEGVTTA